MEQGGPIVTDEHELFEPPLEFVSELNASNPEAVDGSTIFTHTHSDGQAFSGTVEQAQQVCDAMSRLPFEDVHKLLQANDLANQLAQRGERLRKAASQEADQRHAAKPPEPARRAVTGRLVADEERYHQLEEAVAVEQILVAPHRDETHPSPPLLAPQEVGKIVLAQPAVAVKIENHTVPEETPEQQAPWSIIPPSSEIFNENVPVVGAITIMDPMVEQPIPGELLLPQVIRPAIPAPQPTHQQTVMIAPEAPEQVPELIVQPSESVADGFEELAPTHESEYLISEPEALKDEPLPVIAELPAPTQAIEIVLGRLSDMLEQPEAEVTIRLQQIIEKIIALPNQLQDSAEDQTDRTDEQLSLLFAELFESAEIAYTPELIESFVQLTKAHYFRAIIEPTIDEDGQKNRVPLADIGTREFLQRLQRGVRLVQRLAKHFCAIGRSALDLYRVRTSQANLPQMG